MMGSIVRDTCTIVMAAMSLSLPRTDIMKRNMHASLSERRTPRYHTPNAEDSRVPNNSHR